MFILEFKLGVTYLWLAGNEGRKKKMATTTSAGIIQGPFFPCYSTRSVQACRTRKVNHSVMEVAECVGSRVVVRACLLGTWENQVENEMNTGII